MRLIFPPLYAIIDASLLKTSELSFAELMAESGVELLQYRNKSANARRLFDISQLMSRALSTFTEPPSITKPMFAAPTDALAPRSGVRFIVNDRPDVALLAGAGGVHVGQRDLGVEQTRAIVGGECWVGVSTHTLEQVDAADRTSADYVAFGPVFPTATKENPDPVVGLKMLAEARLRTSKPLVAIGGITLERAPDTWRAGADSLAVARDLLCAEDPGTRAREFLAEAARLRAEDARGGRQL